MRMAGESSPECATIRPWTAPRDVAVIRLDNPPVNGLAHGVRGDVVAGIDAANADPAVRAIVIAGAAKLFSAGADVRSSGRRR
jgi:3-hydroxyacyl-CoA dehydrogenase